MTQSITEEEILQRMVHLVAEIRNISPDAVDIDADHSTFGIDSVKVFNMTGDLAEWLQVELSAALFWENKTLRSLAKALLAESKAK